MGVRRMNKELFLDKLEVTPVIAAIKCKEDVQAAIEAESEVIFLLTSDLFSIQESVSQLKEADKMVFVHFDLIDGLSKNVTALKYIAEMIKPDGIISTKTNIISAAKKMGLLTIQRHFIVDSISLKNSIDMIQDTKPDAVEVLPGLITKVIEQIKVQTAIPIIAGGLISDKSEVMGCISAGVSAISSTNKAIWNI